MSPDGNRTVDVINYDRSPETRRLLSRSLCADRSGKINAPSRSFQTLARCCVIMQIDANPCLRASRDNQQTGFMVFFQSKIALTVSSFDLKDFFCVCGRSAFYCVGLPLPGLFVGAFIFSLRSLPPLLTVPTLIRLTCMGHAINLTIRRLQTLTSAVQRPRLPVRHRRLVVSFFAKTPFAVPSLPVPPSSLHASHTHLVPFSWIPHRLEKTLTAQHLSLDPHFPSIKSVNLLLVFQKILPLLEEVRTWFL